MPETNNTVVSPVERLIADCRVARKRLKDHPPEDVIAELRNNVYPMIIAVLEQVAEVDEVVQEVVDQTGSFIDDNLAEQIISTIVAGGVLITEIKPLLENLDEIKRKRLSNVIAEFERSAELTVMGVRDATDYELGDHDGEDDEDDEDVSGEEDEENEDDETEAGEEVEENEQ